MSIELKVSPNIKILKNMISDNSKEGQNNSSKENENPKSKKAQKYSIKLLTSFGCNTSGLIQDCINFVTRNNYILYNVGNNIIIREISFIDNDKDQLNQLLIYQSKIIILSYNYPKILKK